MSLRMLFAALLLLPVSTLRAQSLDWTAELPPVTGPIPVEVTASASLSDGSTAVAALGDTLYGASSSVRVALISKVSAAGQLLWQTELPRWPGATPAPTDILELASGDLLLLASSRLIRMRREHGSVLWVSSLPGSFTRLQPAADGLVFALGSTDSAGGSSPGAVAQVLKLSPEDGSTLWTYQHPSGSSADSAIGASSFADGDLVVALASRELVRIDSVTGGMLWRLPPVTMPAAELRRVLVDAEDRVIDFHGGSNGGLALRTGSNGDLIWQAAPAAGLEDSRPVELLSSAAGRVLVISQPLEGYSQGQAATRVHAVRLSDGGVEWQRTAFSASSGARYVRSVARTQGSEQIGLLLSPSAQRARLSTLVAPGRRILLVSALDGALTANAEMPANSDLLFADDLRAGPSGLFTLVGARAPATGSPGMFIGSIDATSALPASSTDASAALRYSERAGEALALADGSTVVLSERGGARGSVLAITRISASGQGLWRQELVQSSTAPLSWVGVRLRGPGEVVAIARSRVGATGSRILSLDLASGVVASDASLSAPACDGFSPYAFWIEPNSQAIYIAGTARFGCPPSMLIRMADPAAAASWSAAPPQTDFGANGFLIHGLEFGAGAAPLVLLTAANALGPAMDMVLRLDPSTAAPVWTRPLGLGNTFNSMSLDANAGELRVAGLPFDLSPRAFRQIRISLSAGDEIAIETLGCAQGQSAFDYTPDRRYGQRLAGLLSCSSGAGQQALLRMRESWLSSATLSTIMVPDGFDATRMEPASPTHAALVLRALEAEVPSRLARLDVRTGEIEASVELVSARSTPIDVKQLLTGSDRMTVVGEVVDEGRIRTIVASRAGTALFEDGFEGGGSR
jgi:hypothetical protein